MFSTMEFFLLILICMGSRNKISLVAQAATLGNFFNLHKCKMATDQYRRFFYTRTACTKVKCSTSFKVSLVSRIQFQCRILISRSRSCKKGQLTPNVSF